MNKINFQNNITKANADTFNTMQDNIEDAINTSSLDTYSTTEQRIGTWINNKPLYRKVFQYDDLSQITSGSYVSINTGLVNCRAVKIEAINLKPSQEITRLLPYNDGTNIINIVTTYYNQINLRIYKTGTLWDSNDNAVITLYYVKTTD